MTAKNRITINLSDDEYRQLVAVSEQEDRSLAWLGRQAIVTMLRHGIDSGDAGETPIASKPPLSGQRAQ
jgi:predicted transcriptional regulator